MKKYDCAIACLVMREESIPIILKRYKETFENIYIVVDSSEKLSDEKRGVYYRKFDNFQNQRNFLIKKIKEEKILFIDEDEELCIEDYEKFEKALNVIAENKVLYFKYNEKTTGEVGTTNVRGIKRGHKYIGFVHENIYSNNIEYVEMQGCVLIHDGYTRINRKKKAYRNLRLLLKEEKTSRFCYYYIKECINYNCEYKLELLPKVEPENYYMEFLELLILRVPESKEKARYIKGLKKNEIINTLIYLKYGKGKPEKKYEEYFKRRNYGTCIH